MQTPQYKNGRKSAQTDTARLPFIPGNRENHVLGQFAFFARKNRLFVSVRGLECDGILAYLTTKFHNRNANIESCCGERFSSGQGSHFEIRVDNTSDLRRLCLDFLNDQEGFEGKKKLTPVTFADLEVKLARDHKDVLYTVSTLFARLRVNLAYFRANKLDDSLFDDDFEPFETLGGADEPEAPFWARASALARLELPAGVEVAPLKVELEEALNQLCGPMKLKVLLRERKPGARFQTVQQD